MLSEATPQQPENSTKPLRVETLGSKVVELLSETPGELRTIAHKLIEKASSGDLATTKYLSELLEAQQGPNRDSFYDWDFSKLTTTEKEQFVHLINRLAPDGNESKPEQDA